MFEVVQVSPRLHHFFCVTLPTGGPSDRPMCPRELMQRSVDSRLWPVLLTVFLLSCTSLPTPASSPGDSSAGTAEESVNTRTRPVKSPALSPFMEDLEERTFRFFWETTNAQNGLVPDRYPTPSFSSVAAVGFGLTAYGIGAERGYITREQAAERVLTTLRFFRDARQGPEASGITGYKGFFYHFLDMKNGKRFEKVELSTIDTTLFLGGALFCQSYFDRDNAVEKEIRDAVETIYRRVEWDWAVKDAPLVSMGYTPEEGLGSWHWRGYDEAMILYVLALGSPTHAIDPSAWEKWTSTYKWMTFYGYEHVNFAPLFGHQYSHGWIDFRGIQDPYMKTKGIDYFENARRATLSQRAYAIDNPSKWDGWSENIWGLTACDGPIDAELEFKGTKRKFFTYAARGAAASEIRDDGTISPTAAGGSIPFAPEVTIAALEEMHRQYGSILYAQYGFLDSFNPSFRFSMPLKHGRVDPKMGWVDGDYLGIDQGPILIGIENYRTGMVWNTMRKNPHIVRGLKRAGFTGGWLEQVK